MTVLPSSFYQFFGANSQDHRRRVDHLVHKRRVDVQMSNDRDESSPPPKTAADGLPRRDTTRWTARRKVAVVAAVLGGVISREEVCRRYGLSINEVLSWQNTLQMHGVSGLRTTRLQKYRYSRPTRRTPPPMQSTNFDVLMRPPAVTVEVSAAGVISGSARGQSTIRTGDLIVDVKTRVVSIGDKPVQLTEKEYRIIELLSLRKGASVTRETLLGHLYRGMNEPELKIIDVFVCHLRKKLAQATDGKHYIKTVWGGGFLLHDPIKYRG